MKLAGIILGIVGAFALVIIGALAYLVMRCTDLGRH